MDNNYVDDAHDIVRKLVKTTIEDKKNKRKITKIAVTTSQIRKILSAVIILTNKVNRYKVNNPNATELSKDLAAEVKYLKVLISYQAGRDDKKPFAVMDFVKQTDLISIVDGIGDSIEEYYKFNRYVEALVAFHRYESTLPEYDALKGDNKNGNN